VVASGGQARLWDLATSRPLRRFDAVWPGLRGQIHLGDDVLAIVTRGASRQRWSVESGKQLQREDDPSEVERVGAFSPGGAVAIVVDGTGAVGRWDVRSGRVTHLRLRFGRGTPESIAVDSSGTQVALVLTDAGDRRRVERWSLTGPRRLGQHTVGDDVERLAFAGDDIIVSGDVVMRWTARGSWAPACPRAPELTRGTVGAVAGTRAAFVTDMINVVDLTSCRLIRSVFLDDSIDELALSPDGHRLAAGTFGGRAVIWDVTTGQRIAELSNLRHHLWSARAAGGSSGIRSDP